MYCDVLYYIFLYYVLYSNVLYALYYDCYRSTGQLAPYTVVAPLSFPPADNALLCSALPAASGASDTASSVSGGGSGDESAAVGTLTDRLMKWMQWESVTQLPTAATTDTRSSVTSATTSSSTTATTSSRSSGSSGRSQGCSRNSNGEQTCTADYPHSHHSTPLGAAGAVSSDYTHTQSVTQSVVLTARGQCMFEDKAVNAQRGGAAAVIVANSDVSIY